METSPLQPTVVREMRRLQDKRLPLPGREVLLRTSYHPGLTLRCRVISIDDLTAHLRAEHPLPYLPLGTSLTLTHSASPLQLTARLVEVSDPDTFVTQLAPLTEHRAHRRFSLTLGVALDPLDSEGDVPVEGVTVDISESGIRVRVSRPVEVGVRALLWLDLPGDSVISAIVETLASSISADEPGCEARLRFVFMPTGEREMLRVFLARMPAESDPRHQLDRPPSEKD
ncbi:MAG TPA: PilZ domain-containing protein [Acidimicrobiales bacterium]|nr:PilZ domain-containing protein [Acidimicrobiales bacterium]